MFWILFGLYDKTFELESVDIIVTQCYIRHYVIMSKTNKLIIWQLINIDFNTFCKGTELQEENHVTYNTCVFFVLVFIYEWLNVPEQ